jgi:predicted nucleotide-binding protein (sugar kinase/HSP70/actin superfamily)
MGTLSIVLKALFSNLGCQVLVPPPTTKTTMELGMRYSPETICLPFKLILGNFIEALEQGADTLVTCGGVGPCRLGYYSVIQQQILEQLGYQFRMITVEPSLLGAYRQLKLVAPHANWCQMYSAFQVAGAKMNLLDDMGRAINSLRARETVRGSSDLLWRQTADEIDLADNCQALRELREQMRQKLRTVKVEQGGEALRVAIVGEIYVMLEPFVNQNVERCLGEMGVEVCKTMFLSDYVKGHLLRRQAYVELYQRLSALAKPYLRHYVGGHGQKSIAYTLLKKQGYDGIIQVYPFTCMPEVVAKNILPKVSQDIDMPVLTLAYDEQTGEAGIKTRLEAFIDLLTYRQRKLRQRAKFDS